MSEVENNENNNYPFTLFVVGSGASACEPFGFPILSQLQYELFNYIIQPLKNLTKTREWKGSVSEIKDEFNDLLNLNQAREGFGLDKLINRLNHIINFLDNDLTLTKFINLVKLTSIDTDLQKKNIKNFNINLKTIKHSLLDTQQIYGKIEDLTIDSYYQYLSENKNFYKWVSFGQPFKNRQSVANGSLYSYLETFLKYFFNTLQTNVEEDKKLNSCWLEKFYNSFFILIYQVFKRIGMGDLFGMMKMLI